GDPFRMQLLLDPAIDAELQHALPPAGTRPEREAVEHVFRAFALARLSSRRGRRRSAGSEEQRGSGDDQAVHARSDAACRAAVYESLFSGAHADRVENDVAAHDHAADAAVLTQHEVPRTIERRR